MMKKKLYIKYINYDIFKSMCNVFLLYLLIIVSLYKCIDILMLNKKNNKLCTCTQWKTFLVCITKKYIQYIFRFFFLLFFTSHRAFSPPFDRVKWKQLNSSA